MSVKKWDVFISHASEDKDSIVRELADLLSTVGVKVWYDEFTLEVGDSLTQRIDEGLIDSAFGLIIISKAFLNKKWTDYEYRSLLTKEDKGKKIILPIWHGVTHDDIKMFSLYLGDKFALDSSKMSQKEIALKILAVVRPDIYEHMCRILLMKKIMKEAPRQDVKVSDLKWGTKQRESLSKPQLNRIKGFCSSIGTHLNLTFEGTVECYLYDHNPEREMQVWEAMNAAFIDFVLREGISDDLVKKEIANHLLQFSIGVTPDASILREEQLFRLAEIFQKLSTK